METTYLNVCDRPISRWSIVRLLKTVLLLLCVSFSSVYVQASDRNEGITISCKNESLEQVIHLIESQSSYLFVLNDKVNTKHKVSIKIENGNINAILNKIFQGTNMTYQVDGDHILISTTHKSIGLDETRQATMIKGKIVDNAGEPMIGVNVLVKGTTNGAITDFEGNYSLADVNENDVLMVTYIGYLTQEIKVGKQSVINVVMKDDTQSLDEVVVVGYGVQKKSDVTGALTQVSSKTIRERPVQNALQAMQGKAAGVQITSNNRPGELGDVRIRGSRSLNASNDPLYVIDGIPMSVGSMADVNPNDIESMEILKDASATAIYGSRGANGVILITTKKGKTGKVTINYDGTVSFSKIHSMTDWMNSGELIDWNRQANVNAGAYTGKYGNAPDPDIDGDAYFGGVSQYPYLRPVFNAAFQFNADGTPVLRDATQYEKEVLGYADRVPVYNSANIPTTPWTDYVTRTSLTHNHQISLSAGTEKSKLYMSLAYLDQESPMKDQDYKRYTVNMNGEIQATEFLKVGMGINASHSIKNYGIVSNFSNTTAKDSYGLATSLMPYAPAFDENGKILSPDDGPSRHNVLLNIDEALNETRYYGFMLSSFAELDFGKIWTPLEGVKWRTNFGTQYRNSREGSYYGDKFTNPLGYASTEPNVAYNNHNQKLAWTLENMIFYNKTFNKIHTVGLTLMQSAEYYRTEGLDARAYESKFPTALWYSIGDSNKAKLGAGSSFNEQQRASYMARLNYNLMDRYLLTVTGRWDGASMLAAGNKWDFFPSAALAWKMNEENFMKNIGWLNSLKLRVGYGVTGNASINSYQTAGSMVSQWANKPFGQGGITTNTTGAKASVLPNRNLGWEKTASTNFGVDFGFLNNRITGSVEYYIANTSDLLLNRSIPLMTGYTQILTNVGKTQNKGLEITLSTTNIQTEDFTWKTDFTFSTNRSKIVELADGKVDDPTNGWFIGKPMDEIWTYKYDRLWQDTPEDRRMLAIYKAKGNGITMFPGMAKLVDQEFIEVPEGTEGSKTVTLEDGSKVTYMDNGFGKFDKDDYHFQGSFTPKWEGGFTTTFIYKNWQLNAFFYGRFGNMYYGLMQTYGRRVENDTWSPENTDAKFPQPRAGGESFTDYKEYMNYTKGNMVAVRNIALSYTFPEKWLGKIGANSCQIYGQVLNPFIWGGDLVKAGINPDDTTGWGAEGGRSNGTYKYIGGQTNNTVLTRSFVIGLRLGF